MKQVARHSASRGVGLCSGVLRKVHPPHFSQGCLFLVACPQHSSTSGPSLYPGSILPQAKSNTSSAATRFCLSDSRPRTCTWSIPRPSPLGVASWLRLPFCGCRRPLRDSGMASAYGEPEVFDPSVYVAEDKPKAFNGDVRPCQRTGKSGKLASHNIRIACSSAMGGADWWVVSTSNL